MVFPETFETFASICSCIYVLVVSVALKLRVIIFLGFKLSNYETMDHCSQNFRKQTKTIEVQCNTVIVTS